MTEQAHPTHCSCSTDHQFLFCRTGTHAPKAEPDSLPPEAHRELAQAFPELLCGDAFLEAAMERVADAARFGALVVRLDPPAGSAGQDSNGNRLRAAETLQTVCETAGGLWGWIGPDVFGCVFPLADENGCDGVAQQVQAGFRRRAGGTVTIGTARYPTIDFPRNRVLDNARKALDHAAFFGPGGLVAFDAVSLNISGDGFYQEGDINGAITEFERALALDPSNVNVRNSLGVCHGVLGDLEKAAAEFNTAARLDPSEAMALYNLGMVCLLGEGEREKALDYLNRSRLLGGDLFETAFQTGKLYLEMKRPAEARECLERAAEVRPASGMAHRYLGDCWAALEHDPEALSAYQRAVKLNPNDADALSALGSLMDRIGENVEVSTAFCEHSVAIAPNSGLFRYRLGRLYAKQERFEDAVAQFQKAVELGHDAGPDLEWARVRIDAGGQKHIKQVAGRGHEPDRPA